MHYCNQVHVPAIALADNYYVAVVRALLRPGARAIALGDNYCVALVHALLNLWITIALVQNYCIQLDYFIMQSDAQAHLVQNYCSHMHELVLPTFALFGNCQYVGTENVSLKMPFILSPRITQCNAMQCSIDWCHCIELPLQH